jgi:hypothetical protein
MRRTPLVIAALCIVLAVLIFVFAEGARRLYAGAFFAVLGVVVAMNAKSSAKRQ